MKETRIQFNGRRYSVRCFGEQPYQLESLVIMPVKAKEGKWSTEYVGLNNSRYLIYSPWDTQQGTGISLLVSANPGIKFHLAIFSARSSRPVFECDAEMQEDDELSAFYPQRLKEGKYYLFVSDVRLSEQCDSHYHAVEQGFFFEFDVLRHGSALSLPKLGIEGSIERLDSQDYVGTSGEVRFCFQVLSDLPDTYKLSWHCYDSTFNEIESLRHGLSVEYDYAQRIYSDDGRRLMLIKIDSYIPWMPDSLYTIVLYYNDELFACCRFSLNSLGLERKFLIAPIDNLLHRDLIETEMDNWCVHPMEEHTFFYPDGIMRIFMDYLTFYSDGVIPPAFEKELAMYIMKYYDLLAGQSKHRLETIIFSGPMNKAEKRHQRAVERGECAPDSPIIYDADKDLHGFAKEIKEWSR
ncbi:MAG: hypothetical protein IJZ45_04315 [Bacteroidaceae bacterium]|nr:hypothetical protein [Bacteroidaceae bacterium]